MATSVDEHRARLDEAKEEIRKLHADHEGELIDPESTDGIRWNDLNAEVDLIEKTIAQIEARDARIAKLAGDPDNTEPGSEPQRINKNRFRKRVPDDPTRIEEYRNLARSMDDLNDAYRDGAQKVVETRFFQSHPDIDLERAQGNVSRLLDTVDLRAGEDGERSLARRVIATSSREYEKEFATYLRTQGRVVGPEMERAASLTTTAGGFAVPVVLDPTVILVSSGVINPVRQLARVVQTTGNTVEFITSTGITAAYSAEATEASDNAPALAQPTANVEKAQAFVPGSIEIFEDWGAIRSEMARLFSDAKDTLENTQFLTGVGHTSNVPQGLIAVGGATAVVTSASTAVIAAADLYNLETALSPRWRARASIVGNRAAFQKVRQLDTSGGANLWVQLSFDNPATLLGYPAYEWSAYSSAVTTSASTVLTIGDFNEFAIVDRVGMSVEFIPHLFGSSNRFPTGQRGLYMYWRNTSKVLTPGLQANSAFVSLKLL